MQVNKQQKMLGTGEGVNQMEKCRICGKTPSIVDIGGNNPYYEITCCDQTVGSHDRESAEGGWNMMQKGELNEDIGN